MHAIVGRCFEDRSVVDFNGQIGIGHRASADCEGDPTCVGRPKKVALPRRAIQVAVGDENTLVLLEDGAVFGWGENAWAQLGVPPTDPRPTPAAIPLPPLK